MRPKSKIPVVCQNPTCNYYCKKEGKHIIKRGKNRANHQQYLCLHCGRLFLETTNGFFFNRHLSEKEIIEIMELLSKNNGIRSISRITGHDRGVVSDLLVIFALNACSVDAFLFNRLKKSRADIVVFWTTVLTSRKEFSVEARLGLKKILEKHEINANCSVQVIESSNL